MRIEGGEVNRGIIEVLVIIILVIVILQFT
jgi:hypothetical protein